MAGGVIFAVRSPCRWNMYTPRMVSLVRVCARAIGTTAANAASSVVEGISTDTLPKRVDSKKEGVIVGLKRKESFLQCGAEKGWIFVWALTYVSYLRHSISRWYRSPPHTACTASMGFRHAYHPQSTLLLRAMELVASRAGACHWVPDQSQLDSKTRSRPLAQTSQHGKNIASSFRFGASSVWKYRGLVR